MVINFKKIILVITVLLLTKSAILVSADDAAQRQLNRGCWSIFRYGDMFNFNMDLLNLISFRLNRGANPNWVDNFDNVDEETSLFYAIRLMVDPDKNQLERNFCSRAIRLLLRHGASVNFRNRNGLTPLALANQLGIPEVLRQN